MAENAGNVLYQRGKDDDNEDIWDDTALIKAYDEAVSLMKIKVAEQNGLSVTDEDLQAATKPSKGSRKRAKSKKTRKWKVGDRCRARFSEDQCLYEAEVISVDDSTGMCYVRYVDYGNEEEQSIKDLLRVHRQKHRQESENETDSGMDWQSRRSSQQNSHSTSHPAMAPPNWPGMSENKPPFPGPMFPGMMGLAPPPPPPPPIGHFSSAPKLPFMPPPPPPPVLGDISEETNEALCSMLMAWYMSGYHTGYYQGLQQGKKDSGIGSSFVNR